MAVQYRFAKPDEMVQYLDQVLRGKLTEHEALVQCIKDGIRVPAKIVHWLDLPDVKSYFRTSGKYPDFTLTLGRRLDEVPQEQRQIERSVRALMEYLYREDTKQVDMRGKYSDRLFGGGSLGPWYDKYKSQLSRATGYTESELGKKWAERKALGFKKSRGGNPTDPIKPRDYSRVYRR